MGRFDRSGDDDGRLDRDAGAHGTSGFPFGTRGLDCPQAFEGLGHPFTEGLSVFLIGNPLSGGGRSCDVRGIMAERRCRLDRFGDNGSGGGMICGWRCFQDVPCSGQEQGGEDPESQESSMAPGSGCVSH